MPLIKSCCCWRSLRCACYATAIYTMVYFTITIIIMGHFIDVQHRYVSSGVTESTLEPDKVTPKSGIGRLFGSCFSIFSTKLIPYLNTLHYTSKRLYPVTITLNISLLACSTMGLISCVMLILGVYKDIRYLLLPWIVTMALVTFVEIINLVYLFYLQSVNFNPITSYLFALDFIIIVLNVYATICVISQFQEYVHGRGTAAFDHSDRRAPVQYTATAQHTTTTSSAPSGRRRSAGRPLASRCDPEEYSEAPSKIGSSALSKPSRSAVKKHVQFPDEIPPIAEEQADARVISSLWMELESEAPVPER